MQLTNTNPDDVHVREVDSWLVIHALAMTLVLFIGFPLSHALYITKQDKFAKAARVVNVSLTIIFGIIAAFSFSDGNTFHSKFGIIITIILLIQTSYVANYISTQKIN